MRQIGRKVAAAIIFLVALSAAHAEALLDKVQLVADAAGSASPIPSAQTFTIDQSGSYTVTLTDLQLPVALASVSLAIGTSKGAVVQLAAAGTQTVTLQAGTYSLQVLALAAPGAVGGAFGVQVTGQAGGTPVFQYSDAVGAANPAPSTGQSILSAKFTVAADGTYQLSATDLAFPVALSSLQLIIFNDCGTSSGCVTSAVSPTPLSGGAISTPLTLAAGNYDLFAVAATDPTALQGLYSIQIAGGPASSTVYSSTNLVGQLPAPIAIPVSTSGTVSLQLADLVTPAALQSMQAIVIENTNVLQQISSAGTVTFQAAAGTAQLYVLGQPDSSKGQGSYEAYARMGSQVLTDVARPVLAPGSYGYAYPVTLSTSGSYQVGVYDFQLPQPFSALSTIVAQAGVVLASSTNSSSPFAAVAGPLSILVFPSLSSTTANGLFGAQLVSSGENATPSFETTQGVGALFSAQTLTVTQAGSYDLTLADLAFPSKFASIAVIATRGYSLAGQIFGSGSLSISTTPGTYVLNVFAQVGSAADYGWYGINVVPSPSVTLAASAISVTKGGQTTLTWNSTDASNCAASASPSAPGWNGALANSGTQSTGALTAATTFSISCVGQSGLVATATAAVAVSAPAAKGSGGGGSMSVAPLLALLGALGVQIARRRRNALCEY